MTNFLAEELLKTPVVDLPPVLRNLSQSVQEQLSDTLSNDEASTDDEMVEFWTTECGISPDVARAAVQFRSYFFTNVFFELFPGPLAQFVAHLKPAY